MLQRGIASFCLVQCVFLLASCDRIDRALCSYKMDHLESRVLSLDGVKRQKPTINDQAIVEQLKECSPQVEYAGTVEPYDLEMVLVRSDGQKLLVLGLRFVADAKIIIVVDREGKTTDQFIAGM